MSLASVRHDLQASDRTRAKGHSLHKRPSSVESSHDERDAFQRHRDRASWILSQHRATQDEISTHDRWAWPIIGLYLLMAACLVGGAVASAPTTSETASTSISAPHQE